MTPAGMPASTDPRWPGRDTERMATAADRLAVAITERERMEVRIKRRLLPHITRGNDR